MENKEETKNNLNDNEITFDDLFKYLWKKKTFIFIFTAFFSFLSVIYSLNLQNQYTSSALLSVQDSNSETSVSGFGNLASFAGISLPEVKIDNSTIAIETIKSRFFFKNIYENKNITAILLATESYDVRDKKVIFDESIYNFEKKSWVNGMPSFMQAFKQYSSNLDVSKDKSSGLLKISMTHKSPEFAKEFLSLVIYESDQMLRKKDLNKANKLIDYLVSEFSKTSYEVTKVSLSKLIESQMEKKMLANLEEGYIFEVLDPPFVPEEKSKPARSIICIIGALSGLFLSVFYQVFRRLFSEKI